MTNTKPKYVFREETTDWGPIDVYGNSSAQNHIYVFANKLMVGYVKRGTKKVYWTEKPSRQWSPSRRTFRYLSAIEIEDIET
jgi:hypothetical protein